MLKLDKKVALAAAKKIPIESTHLVVSQNFLPFLWEQGVFGGRTFDVLMNRLPLEKLHERLDFAHSKYPESITLNDFRAPLSLIDLENVALTKAKNIITPHQEIAKIFRNKSIQLEWSLPKKNTNVNPEAKRILFPASGIRQKGGLRSKKIGIGIRFNNSCCRQISRRRKFLERSKTEFATQNFFDGVGLVVYPTYIEHQPRLLLKALALNIPVVTTTACGLPPSKSLTVIEIGDYDALQRNVEMLLNQNLFFLKNNAIFHHPFNLTE